MQQQDLVTLTIDGREVSVPRGSTVLHAAQQLGIEIPSFCYSKKMDPLGACRMCLVQIEKVKGFPPSCATPVAPNMVVRTSNTEVVKTQQGILEFLLINHPLDCPICDRGGECPLQNNTLFYGPPTSRYIEEKRHYPKAYPLSENVVFDRERCIHCARCTRFTEDISGDAQLGFLKRGGDMEVGTYANTELKSKFSGNVIELCPVGALLSRTYRFKARPWDLSSQRSVCSNCSNGCNIKIDYRLNALQRVNARVNEAVNEEWTCDKGKFGHDYVSAATRLKKPLLKKDGQWTPIEWTEAYKLLVEKLKAANGKIGGIGGARATNEDNYVWQKFFRDVLKTPHLDSRISGYMGPTNAPLFNRFGYHGMGNSIADLEKMKTIFVLGSELAEEQPILFLRVRKAWRFKGATVINAVTETPQDTTQVGDFAAVEMVYKPGTEIALLNGLLNVLFAKNLLPEDTSVDLTALKNSVANWTQERTSAETGVPAQQIEEAAILLATGPMAILAGKTVTEHPQYVEIVAALGDLITATGNIGNLNVPGTECNTQGAMDMGILPDFGPGYTPIAQPGMNTRQMLEAAAGGELDVLWLVGAKLREQFPDKNLVASAMQRAFVVINELEMTETAQFADLVLPAASVAEKDGAYTNCERRVQRIYKAFDISPDIKPDWLIFSEIAAQMGSGTPFFSARDILRDIAANVPLYAGLTPKSLGEAGIRWNY